MDPYVYPGTSVLKNRRGITDAAELSLFETNHVTRRVLELLREPVPGRLDPAHLRAIHGYLFQDVYDWAGEFRTVNIARSGQYFFAFWDRIEPALHDTLAKLSRERHLAGLEREAFCARAGYFLGEINAVHPFRDGNGRAQREFIRQLAKRNGFTLNWARVTRDQMRAASMASFLKGDNTGLAEALGAAID